jgi:hypothetical protein
LVRGSAFVIRGFDGTDIVAKRIELLREVVPSVQMASAPALPEATVSGQFVQIFGRKENPRGGDVLVKVRHR